MGSSSLRAPPIPPGIRQESLYSRCLGCREAKQLFVSWHAAEQKRAKESEKARDRYDRRPAGRVSFGDEEGARVCREVRDAFGTHPLKRVVATERRAGSGVFCADCGTATTQDLFALLAGRGSEWSVLATCRIVFDGWTPEQALAEMHRFHYHGFWLPEMTRYIRDFPRRLRWSPVLARYRYREAVAWLQQRLLKRM